MRCLFTDEERYAKFWENLTSQEILSYHASHGNGCLRKEVCSGSKIVEKVPNDRFWIDKSEDAA
jgi:hypothetical protein